MFRPLALLGLCLALVVACLVDAERVGAANGNQGVSSFFDADGPITELSIGADLSVHLADVTPGADYRVRLLDESNAIVGGDERDVCNTRKFVQ